MASKITYTDKEALYENPDIEDINKVNADDMNEIKRVVNENADLILGEEVAISTTEPTEEEKVWINPTTNVPKYLYNGSWQELSMSLLDGMPIGFITAYMGTTIPTGWLECDGSTITQTDYPDLYALIGGTLPNFKGRTIVGQDTSDTDFDTIGKTGGSKKIQLSTENYAWNSWMSYGLGNPQINTSFNEGTSYGIQTIYDGTNKNTPFNNMNPYGVAKWIIKAKNTTPTMASIVDAYSTSTTDGYSANYVNTQLNTKVDTDKNYTEVSMTTTTGNIQGGSWQDITTDKDINLQKGVYLVMMQVNYYSTAEGKITFQFRCNGTERTRQTVPVGNNELFTCMVPMFYTQTNDGTIPFKIYGYGTETYAIRSAVLSYIKLN